MGVAPRKKDVCRNKNSKKNVRAPNERAEIHGREGGARGER